MHRQILKVYTEADRYYQENWHESELLLECRYPAARGGQYCSVNKLMVLKVIDYPPLDFKKKKIYRQNSAWL